MDKSLRPPMRWRKLMPCALVAMVLAAGGCAQPKNNAQWVTGDPAESGAPSGDPLAGPPSPDVQATAEQSAAPSASPSKARPATTNPPAAADRTAPSISGAAVTDGVSVWYVITGVHQTGCGEPTKASIVATVKDAVGVARVWFDYETRTKAPLRGSGTAAVADRAAGRYRGTLGPFAADPRNASGGSISIVLHAADAAGNQSSARLSATLLSCQRQG